MLTVYGVTCLKRMVESQQQAIRRWHIMIIGIGHKKFVGKNTLARFIAENVEDVKIISFASLLKKVAHMLYGWAGVREEEYYERYPECKTDATKIGKSVRQIWIDLGTKAIRNNVYEDTWVEATLNTDYQARVLIIPDLRFPNEARAIKERNGKLIKLSRPGLMPTDDVADCSLDGFDGWDRYVINDSLDHLNKQAKDIATWIKKQLKDC